MRVREFLSDLQRRLDAAVARQADPGDIVATYWAPSSAFLGPGFRPKLVGEGNHGGEGRYGLTLDQAARVVGALTGKLPPLTKEGQKA